MTAAELRRPWPHRLRQHPCPHQHHEPPQDATVPASQESAAVPIIEIGCSDLAAVVAAVHLAAAEWGVLQGERSWVSAAATDAMANWRDTLYLRMAPAPPAAGDLSESCR
ncbi:hypothetical protein ZWY2020_046080 [Hordeum vulgare]|nr:hypothetical protein ZWY2020_046080 [Hordeum vulgare]